MKDLLPFMAKMGKGIEKDLLAGRFDNPEFKGVPWLKEVPTTAEEVAINIAQRLEAGGYTLQFSTRDIDRDVLGRFLVAEENSLQK